jgi:hypothetical protein
MTETKFCCERLSEAVADKTIYRDCVDGRLEIYGPPDSADDGDGYMDDMTSRIEIKFCPFCGSELATLEIITK